MRVHACVPACLPASGVFAFVFVSVFESVSVSVCVCVCVFLCVCLCVDEGLKCLCPWHAFDWSSKIPCSSVPQPAIAHWLQ